MDWAYGVTTVPSRKGDLLPMTLASLKRAGFPCPRLFVDGCKDPAAYDSFGLEVTTHFPSIRTAGNWILALWELLHRFPDADRFAIFQDDFVTYPNLRDYLEKCKYPERGYLNLITFPENQDFAKGRLGWYQSTQTGRGAVALVFNLLATQTLLSSPHLPQRTCGAEIQRRHKRIDGGVVDAFRMANWQEYVHSPSLVDHRGTESTTSSGKWHVKTSFRGEAFDAIDLLKEQEA